MVNYFDACVCPGLCGEAALEDCKQPGAKHPKKKLLRSPPVRLEDVRLCRIPQCSALKMPKTGEDETMKKKKAVKCVRFSDEISIYRPDQDEFDYSEKKKDSNSCEDREERGQRLKVVLTKQEAAELVAMSQGQQQTLRDLLMQLSTGKEPNTTWVSDQSPTGEESNAGASL